MNYLILRSLGFYITFHIISLACGSLSYRIAFEVRFEREGNAMVKENIILKPCISFHIPLSSWPYS